MWGESESQGPPNPFERQVLVFVVFVQLSFVLFLVGVPKGYKAE